MDDPSAPSLLRADLASAREAHGAAIDVVAGLAALEATLHATKIAASASASASATASAKSIAIAIAKGAFWGIAAIGAAGIASTYMNSSAMNAHAIVAIAPIVAPAIERLAHAGERERDA